MPEDPAPDSSFAKELEINQRDGRRWAPRQRHGPKNKPLLMSVWVLLVSLPFSQSVDKTLYICGGFFAIYQPSKDLGRVSARHQPTDGQFFPSSSTVVSSFLGSFRQRDALADPSFTSPSNAYGCLLKQGGEAACPWGTGMCLQSQPG